MQRDELATKIIREIVTHLDQNIQLINQSDRS